jgi:predicted MPP superfamily phosphohydrolase
MSPFRILHLSDLHICADAIRPHVEGLLQSAKKLEEEFGLDPQLDIQFAEEGRLDDIIKAVRTLDPDVICVTGDLTTFGDHKSFERVNSFFTELQNRGNQSRKIVVTPGNHDALCGQLTALVNQGEAKLGDWSQKLPWCVRWGLNRRFERSAASELWKQVNNMLKMQDFQANANNPLEHYFRFLNGSHCLKGAVGRAHDCEIQCVPFNSVSLEPVWINIGVARGAEFRRFREELRHANEPRGSLVIALLHHNPISSATTAESRLTHAYNSFPAASLYVKDMQDAGADVVLYGHQHKPSVCQMDFVPSDPGHLYLIGARSATAIEGPKTPTVGGFNVIDVHNRFLGSVQCYTFNPSGRHEPEGSEETLVFECERVRHVITISSRNEIRHLAGEEDGFKDERSLGLSPGALDLLVVRPRGVHLRSTKSIEALKNVLSHSQNQSVRILVSDPTLFELISALPKEEMQRLSRMWGNKHTWDDQAQEARATLGRLVNFKNIDLKGSDQLQGKLEIRKAHTLIPVGAVIRKENGRQHLVFLRLLPVGVDLERRELQLEVRHDDGLTNFYIEYLEALWGQATVHA